MDLVQPYALSESNPSAYLFTIFGCLWCFLVESVSGVDSYFLRELK